MSNDLNQIKFKAARAIQLVEELEHQLKKAYKQTFQQSESEQWKLFALLFARPGNILTKEQIIPNLDYLHFHSGNNIDFYCIGYHKINEVDQSKKIVVEVDNGSWGYSNLDFNKLRQYFETETRWTYSGRTDLILANYLMKSEEIFVDYSNSLAFNIEKAIACKAIASVEEFFTALSNYPAHSKGEIPTIKVFKKQYIGIGKKVLWNYILSFLPESIINLPEQLNTFMMLDLRKNTT